MPAPLKMFLVGFGLLAASVLLALLVMLIAAASSGKSIAGGERAVVLAGGLDFLVAGGAILVFWFVNAASTPLARVAGTVTFAVLDFAALALVFMFTVLVLNR